ncbi:MAG: hypothetical protein AAF533_10015 [Acidobacteriota bacterium]
MSHVQAPARSPLSPMALREMVRADRRRRRTVRRRLRQATDCLAAADLLLGLSHSVRSVGARP